MPRSVQGLIGLLIFLILVAFGQNSAAFAFVGGWTLAYVLVHLSQVQAIKSRKRS